MATEVKFCSDHRDYYNADMGCAQCELESFRGEKKVNEESITSKPNVTHVSQTVDITSEAEARQLTERIKVKGREFYALLSEAHEKQAYRWLGYSTWEEYVEEEFDITVRQSYRQLAQGHWEKKLGQPVSQREAQTLHQNPEIAERAAAWMAQGYSKEDAIKKAQEDWWRNQPERAEAMKEVAAEQTAEAIVKSPEFLNLAHETLANRKSGGDSDDMGEPPEVEKSQITEWFDEFDKYRAAQEGGDSTDTGEENPRPENQGQADEDMPWSKDALAYSVHSAPDDIFEGGGDITVKFQADPEGKDTSKPYMLICLKCHSLDIGKSYGNYDEPAFVSLMAQEIPLRQGVKWDARWSAQLSEWWGDLPAGQDEDLAMSVARNLISYKTRYKNYYLTFMNWYQSEIKRTNNFNGIGQVDSLEEFQKEAERMGQ